MLRMFYLDVPIKQERTIEMLPECVDCWLVYHGKLVEKQSIDYVHQEWHQPSMPQEP